METPTPLTDRWTPTFETLTDLQDTRVWDAEFADVIDEARQRRDQQRWQLDGRVLRARANPVTIRRWLQASSERFPEVYRSSDWKTICHGSAISVSGVPLVADALVNVHHLIFDLLAPEVTS